MPSNPECLFHCTHLTEVIVPQLWQMQFQQTLGFNTLSLLLLGVLGSGSWSAREGAVWTTPRPLLEGRGQSLASSPREGRAGPASHAAGRRGARLLHPPQQERARLRCPRGAGRNCGGQGLHPLSHQTSGAACCPWRQPLSRTPHGTFLGRCRVWLWCVWGEDPPRAGPALEGKNPEQTQCSALRDRRCPTQSWMLPVFCAGRLLAWLSGWLRPVGAGGGPTQGEGGARGQVGRQVPPWVILAAPGRIPAQA